MKKIITALALCSVVLGMASCTRGGNIDRGNGGYIGHHGDRHENTTDISDTDKSERRYNDDLGDDIYNIPHDVRRGIDRAGDDIRDGINGAGDDISNGWERAHDSIERGLNSGGDDIRNGVRDNNMIK